MFEEKANASYTYSELRLLSKRIEELQKAHDEVVDWLAKELGLCVKKEWPKDWAKIGMTKEVVSPRTFALEEVEPPEPKLARCKKEK